jgi:hypothetical protein
VRREVVVGVSPPRRTTVYCSTTATELGFKVVGEDLPPPVIEEVVGVVVGTMVV